PVCRVARSADHSLRSALRSATSQGRDMVNSQLAHGDDVRPSVTEPWTDRTVRLEMLTNHQLVGPPAGPRSDVGMGYTASSLAVGRSAAHRASSAYHGSDGLAGIGNRLVQDHNGCIARLATPFSLARARLRSPSTVARANGIP